MHSRTSFFSCKKLVKSWSQLYSVRETWSHVTEIQRSHWSPGYVWPPVALLPRCYHALMSLVVWWVAPPSEWVERTTRRPCAKSCGDSSGPSTVDDRLPELAYFVATAGPMCIAFVFFWLFDFLLAPCIKKTAKASSSESSDAMFLVWDSCVSCVHKLDQLSRASFLDGELGSSVMGFRVHEKFMYKRKLVPFLSRGVTVRALDSWLKRHTFDSRPFAFNITNYFRFTRCLCYRAVYRLLLFIYYATKAAQ